jgi:hypothetical protein
MELKHGDFMVILRTNLEVHRIFKNHIIYTASPNILSFCSFIGGKIG